jgi:hypothetical protein
VFKIINRAVKSFKAWTEQSDLKWWLDTKCRDEIDYHPTGKASFILEYITFETQSVAVLQTTVGR